MYKINKTINYNCTTFLLTCTTVRVMVCCSLKVVSHSANEYRVMVCYSLKVVENASHFANEYWDETIPDIVFVRDG